VRSTSRSPAQSHGGGQPGAPVQLGVRPGGTFPVQRGRGKAQQQARGRGLRRFVEARVGRLAQTSDGAEDAAGAVARGHGQGSTGAPLPHLHQRRGQQRQRARRGLYIGRDRVGQCLFRLQSDVAGRPFDHVPDLVDPHRTDQHGAAGDQSSQSRMDGAGAHEIAAQYDDDPGSGLRRKRRELIQVTDARRIAGIHPNPAKASDGRQLHALEADPNTAPIVKRIFAEYLAGRGIKAIAEQPNRDGLPCPSAYDPARNPHRTDRIWLASSIRVILTNPRYTGYQVWNRQRKDEVLLYIEEAEVVDRQRRDAIDRLERLARVGPGLPAVVLPSSCELRVHLHHASRPPFNSADRRLSARAARHRVPVRDFSPWTVVPPGQTPTTG
jgi:hypothetical protein